MGTYVNRAMLTTSVSKTTLKRLRRISKSTGIPISRILDEMTADRYARVAAALGDKSEEANVFVSRLVDASLQNKKKLEGSKLPTTDPTSEHSDGEART